MVVADRNPAGAEETRELMEGLEALVELVLALGQLVATGPDMSSETPLFQDATHIDIVGSHRILNPY